MAKNITKPEEGLDNAKDGTAIDSAEVLNSMQEMMLEIENLKKELAESRSMSASTTNMMYGQVGENKYVSVISLLPYELNLSTDPYNKLGNDQRYQFNHFGHEILIPIEDLHKIIIANNRFVREGHFYIADEEFVKAKKLEKQYEKLKDKDAFELLLKADLKTFKKIYTSMIETQKEILRDLFISKIAHGEQFDMNIISYIDSTITSENKKISTAIRNYQEAGEEI